MSWTDKELAEMAKAGQAGQKFAYNDSYFAELEAMLPKKKKRLFPFFVLPLIPMLGIMSYIGMSEPNVTNAVDVAKTYESNTDQIASLDVASNGELTTNDLTASNTTFEASTIALNTVSTKIIKIKNLNRFNFETKNAEPVFAQNEPILENAMQSNLISSNISANQANESVSGKSVVEISKAKLIQKTAQINKKTDMAVSEIIAIAKKVSEAHQRNNVKLIDRAPVKSTETSKLLIAKEVSAVVLADIDRLNKLQLSSPLFAVQPPNSFNRMSPFTPQKTWSMYIEAGVGMGESYLTSQVSHAKTASLGAGMRYDFKNTFVQFGARGEFQKVNMELSDRAKIYHTSSTQLENVMDYKQLYRVQMPFVFGYKLYKHSIQASFIPSYLIGAKMKYTYLENGLALRNETMYNQRKGWNDFSTSVGLGYGYDVFKGLTLGANVNWQFMNQINRNEVSEGNIRPFSGQVFIRKTLK